MLIHGFEFPCEEIRIKMEQAKNEIAESETQPGFIKQEEPPVPGTPLAFARVSWSHLLHKRLFGFMLVHLSFCEINPIFYNMNNSMIRPRLVMGGLAWSL